MKWEIFINIYVGHALSILFFGNRIAGVHTRCFKDRPDLDPNSFYTVMIFLICFDKIDFEKKSTYIKMNYKTLKRLAMYNRPWNLPSKHLLY